MSGTYDPFSERSSKPQLPLTNSTISSVSTVSLWFPSFTHSSMKTVKSFEYLDVA